MIKRLMILGFVVGFALLLYAPPGMTYSSYSGSSGDANCFTCHGDFRGGNPSLHDIHVGGNQMTNNCNLCHGGGNSFSDVRTGASGESPDFSCTGCHIFEGLVVQHPSSPCSTCHGAPTAAPENTIPQWYGRTDVALENPCRIGKNNGGEDWTGDGQGLDNDGDGLHDFNDPDCVGVGSKENSWGAVKVIYGSE